MGALNGVVNFGKRKAANDDNNGAYTQANI